MTLIKYILAICLALCFGRVTSSGTILSDSCDWTGSGSPNMVQSRSIQPVYLRCSQGVIKWYYPRGALRIVLRYGMNGQHDFKACFKMSNGSSGARIFLAGKKRLHLVFLKDSPSDLVRCIDSKDSHVIVYVEADPLIDSLQRNFAEFSYHLKKVSSNHREDDDCQPCTENELLRQFCTSDFVVKGTVSSLFHNHDVQRSELTVRATKIYKDKDPPLFRSSPRTTPNHIDLSQKDAKYAIVYRPLICGTHAGQGEYVFFGSWTLGSPTLTCIPRLSEWKKVRRRALKLGTALCQLDL